MLVTSRLFYNFKNTKHEHYNVFVLIYYFVNLLGAGETRSKGFESHLRRLRVGQVKIV